MTDHHAEGSIRGQLALPMPGLYPCLSWQLNATLHRSTGLAKFVSILREPSDHVEIVREFMELEPWEDVRTAVQRHTVSMLSAMQLLAGPGSAS